VLFYFKILYPFRANFKRPMLFIAKQPQQNLGFTGVLQHIVGWRCTSTGNAPDVCNRMVGSGMFGFIKVILTRRMLRYAPRFHTKKSFFFFFWKIKKLVCLNSYACHRGSACKNLGGLDLLVKEEI
jgi:hypothetical protein